MGKTGARLIIVEQSPSKIVFSVPIRRNVPKVIVLTLLFLVVGWAIETVFSALMTYSAGWKVVQGTVR